MNFFIRHRDRFRTLAISSFVALNFFMIAACWTGEDGAWAATFLIAGLAIVCSLICHFTQSLPEEETTRDFEEKEYNPINTTNENEL